jgi:hypothetical protein
MITDTSPCGEGLYRLRVSEICMTPLAPVDVVRLAMVALGWVSILSISMRGSQMSLWHRAW